MSSDTAPTRGAEVKPARRSVGRPATTRERGVVALEGQAAGLAAMNKFISTPDCELINSLARGLQVLAAFGPEDDLLGNKDIAGRTGIPKPTISRLTDTLLKLNFLQQDSRSGHYRLGPAALALGVSAHKRIDLSAIARPFLEQFAAIHDVTVLLGVMDGLEIRASSMTGSAAPVGLRFGLGASFPLDGTALGLGLLCGMDESRRGQVLGQLEVMRGAAWPQSQSAIANALQEYRINGFCTSIEEWSGLVNALGAPLVVDHADTQLSIGCCGPAQHLTPPRLKELSPYFMGLVGSIQSAARQQISAGYAITG